MFKVYMKWIGHWKPYA